MEKKYHEIYDRLYQDYVYEQDFMRKRRPIHPDEYYITKSIKKSIDKSNENAKLRPDSKYFLVVNFHHLIIRPLIDGKPYRSRSKEKILFDIEDSIHSDINTIINHAVESSEGNNEISGHVIMRCIDQLWPKLKTTKFEIWG